MTEQERQAKGGVQFVTRRNGYEYWAKWYPDEDGGLWQLFTEEECEGYLGDFDTFHDATQFALQHSEG